MALKLRNPQLSKLAETPQKRTYTVVGVSLVVVLLLTFFAIRPSIASVFDQLSKNNDKRDMLERMDQKYDNLLSLSKQEQSKERELALLAEAMPSVRQEEFIQSNVEKIIEEEGLSMEIISFDTRQVKSIMEAGELSANTMFAEVTISVGGEREEIVRLIQKLEDFPRVLNIKEISIRAIESEEEKKKFPYKSDINIEIYYFEE